ncbi:MAG: hypothetical protein RLZZ502_1158, partial [Pseudomonadota bacterium]
MFARYQSNRSLQAVKQTAQRLIGAQGDNNLQSIASKLIEQYEGLDDTERLGFFHCLATEFNPDPKAVKVAADAYLNQADAEQLIALTRVVEPRRQELLRRINRAPQGTKAIIAMRRAVLAAMRKHPPLAAIDADMHHLLSSWFNPGFLELQKITWQSPAELLEKIILHESVHAIDGWDDLRRRLQPDRRCYAFFHPQLPGEPLIFVEVALVNEMAANVGSLIDKEGEIGTAKSFKAAVFYSISNCQPGLRGVSLGNFLIKRVAEELLREIPTLKTFATLSPIPGLMSWLRRQAPVPEQALSPTQTKHYRAAKQVLQLNTAPQATDVAPAWSSGRANAEEKQALIRLAAFYLA